MSYKEEDYGSYMETYVGQARNAPSGELNSSGPAGVGSKLRAARQAAGFTINDLAKLSGLSKGFVSKVEREETSPSVKTLVELCGLLEITVGSLFEEPETDLVRRREQPIVSRVIDGDLSEWLVTPRSLSNVQVIHAILGPGASAGDELFSVRCQVEIAYVLTGELLVKFANRKTLVAEGESLTFPGLEPHSYENASTEAPTEVIWTLAPAPGNRNNSNS